MSRTGENVSIPKDTHRDLFFLSCSYFWKNIMFHSSLKTINTFWGAVGFVNLVKIYEFFVIKHISCLEHVLNTFYSNRNVYRQKSSFQVHFSSTFPLLLSFQLQPNLAIVLAWRNTGNLSKLSQIRLPVTSILSALRFVSVFLTRWNTNLFCLLPGAAACRVHVLGQFLAVFLIGKVTALIDGHFVGTLLLKIIPEASKTKFLGPFHTIPSKPRERITC